MDDYIVRFGVFDSAKIVNYLGPNTEDVRPNNRLRIDDKKIQERNSRDNFYNNLEESILREGFRNPIIVSAGWISGGIFRNLSPQIQASGMKNLIICHQLGGSRLYMAQKHGLEIPCIVRDYANVLPDLRILNTEEDVRKLFKDQPAKVICDGKYLRIEWPGQKI